MSTERYEPFRRVKIINESRGSIEIAEDGTEESGYILDENGLDFGTVEAAHNMTQFIDLVGQHLDSTVLQPRDIEITGWIIGTDWEDIQKKKAKLDKIVNPLRELTAEFGEYAIDFRPDASIYYAKDWDSNNAYMVNFMIQGTAPMPLFRLKKYTEFRQNVEKVSEFHFPIIIPKSNGVKMGYFPYESVRNMPNSGDVPHGMEITITADSGDVQNPRIVNMSTGAEIRFNYTLKQGDSLIINTELGAQTVTLLQGSLKTNAIKYVTIESDIDMVLELGFNRMMLYDESGEEADATIMIRFSPRFLEVEGR